MDVIVGSNTGVLKAINLVDSTCTNLNFSTKLNKQDETVALCWWKSRDENEDENPRDNFLCAQLNRQVKLCHCSKDGSLKSEKLETLFTCSGGEGKICGLEMVDGNILTCVESGLIKLWSQDGEDKKLDLSSGANTRRMRCSAQNPNLLATGGKENPLKICDLTSQNPSKPVFTSKNIKNDWLELRVPVSVTDFRFLENNDLVATCTANNFIRLYDRSSNCRRPIIQIKQSDHPFTSMCLTFNERQVIVGSSRGFMGLFDFRAPGKLIHAFKGFAGSISAVEAHPTEPYVASCGLDRFVLVHNVKTKKLLHKIYCKAHLNALLLKEDLSIL